MEATIGPGDSLQIAAAMAECASFFLLRREAETEQMDVDNAKQFADFWLQVLGQYLSSETISSMARAAEGSLLYTLSESFYKLDESSYNRPHSAVYRIQDRFWNGAIESTVLDTKGSLADRRWAELLNSIIVKRQGTEMQQSRADPLVRKRFHATLSRYQDASGSYPDVQAYELMIASVRYCGAQYIFAEGDEKTGLEQFLMNDLLRWIVIDTSSLSTNKGQKTLAKLDFTLLRESLLAVTSPHKQKTMWETILREIIAAQCDIALLSEGLIVLMEQSDEAGSSDVWKKILRCEALENFAINVGEETVMRQQNHFLKEFVDHVEDETYEDEARKASMFLGTCVGLAPGSSTTLVNHKVVHQWTEAVAPEAVEQVFELGGDVDIQNPLMTMLLSLISRGDVSLISPEDAERILLESWRRGGRIWSEESVPLLLTLEMSLERQLCSAERIINSGTKELHDLLESFCQTNDSDLNHVALVCHVWSQRAFRILRLCREAAKASDNVSLPQPSLALIGLSDEGMWKSALWGKVSVSHLYLCFVYVLQQFDSQSDRLELFLHSSNSSSSFAMNVLLAISDASSCAIVDPVTRRDHRCAFALSLLGGSYIPKDLLQSWCREAILILSADTKMKSSSQDDYVRATRGISVLSEILFAMFERVIVDKRFDASDVVNASDVSEGDEVWYVTDEDSARAKAQVVKVHSDDFPRLYFTIRIERSDGVKERQTVAERLRRLPQPPGTCGDAIVASFPESEKDQRVRFGDMIFEDVVKPVLLPLPYGEEKPVIEVASECLNIIIAHCGLIGKEGVASTRYEVFKLLSSVQSHVGQSLISEDGAEFLALSLRVLALSMGLGNVAPASKSNFKLMKFNPDESVKAILRHHESYEVSTKETSQLERATLEWLTVAVREVGDEGIRNDASSLMYKMAASTLVQDGKSARDKVANSVLAMRAVQNAEPARSPNQEAGDSAEDYEKAIMIELVKAFASDWQGAREKVCQYQVLDASLRTCVKLPDWYRPFQSLIETLIKLRRGMVAMAARSSCNNLVENLFSHDKRWLAFRLLDASANGQPLHDDNFVSATTQRRLDAWQQDLIGEEAEELQDDVGLVGQWIPENLMNELERWEENKELVVDDEVAALGRMLCWLNFLSFVDSAAAVDVRFRGSVSAYLDYVNVESVLGTALAYLNLEKDRNTKQNIITIQDALNDASSLALSNISALVMFRSVEVFPTFFKNWWEDNCPKGKREAVSQFVETKIAPEALRRELMRINNATDLGEMTVSGSIVSREVTATYTQDEVNYERVKYGFSNLPKTNVSIHFQCQLSIVITVPPNFPLRNVEVDGRRTSGIPERRWKRWALQIRQMLNNQDGSLLDALMLW